MHDSILQIKNSLQDPWQKFENDMQKIIQELKENFPNGEVKILHQKWWFKRNLNIHVLLNQKKSIMIAGQIQVHHLKIMTRRFLIKKKARGQFFPGLYSFFPGPRIISPGARTESPRTKVKHREYT